MNIILGCEESQAVCIELRKLGHNAYSCDLQECSGGHPEWHFRMDIFKAIEGGWLVLQNGEKVCIDKWHMGIFFPTCTYLTITSNAWYKDQPALKSGALVGAERTAAREEALQFVKNLMNANIDRIAIENPVGVIGSRIFWYCGGNGPDRWEVFPRTLKHGGRKPDQIIHPYYFGDPHRKTTCLWLKNLPKLFHSKQVDLFTSVITHVDQGESIEWTSKKTGKKKRQPKWYASAKQGKELGDRSRERSKTFPKIAEVIATQWGNL